YPQFRMEGVEFHGLNHVSLELQVRTVPGMTDESIKRDLENLIRPINIAHPHLEFEIEWPSRARSRDAVAYPPSHPVARRLADWHEYVTGDRAEIGGLGRLGAAADASHVVAAG